MKEVQLRLLEGCTGLTALDLAPLSQLTVIQGAFLYRCTGLTALDLSPLSQVMEVQQAFLCDCTGINAVDNPPPLRKPPTGWSAKGNQWIRKKNRK